jgi:predicted nucleic acid-binding protein
VTGQTQVKDPRASAEQYANALFGLTRSALTLSSLVDGLLTAQNWETARTYTRLIDQHIGTIAADVNVARAWMELSATRRARPPSERPGPGDPS